MIPLYKYKCTVLKAVDGDTVDCLVDLGFGVSLKHRFRMAWIDAAELNSGDPVAKMAKDFMQSKVGSTLFVESVKADKYGRYLGVFYPITDISKSINAEMIELGIARVYKG